MIPAPAGSRPRRPGSRCWTLCTPSGRLDVEVTAVDDQRLDAVLPALGAALGVPEARLWAGSTALPDDLPLGAPELAHGAVLGVGRPGPRSGSASPSSALELHVVSGPDAGGTVPLGMGDHLVGRGAQAGIALSDPDVSRRHLMVRVGPGGSITVDDLGSTNGTTLDDVPLDDRPRIWRVGAVIRLGSTALTVAGPVGFPASIAPGTAGRRVLTPTPRIGSGRPVTEITLPRPLTLPARRRLAWLAVGLPAAVGILMAVLLHAPHFLLFALLSPAMAVGNWISERWSGRRGRRREERRYGVELRAARERIAAAVRADTRALEAAHPDLAVLTTATRRRTSLVWSRRRDDDDALTVRLGTAPGETRVIEIASDGSRSPVPADHLPAVVDLKSTGGLGVVGPRAPALGVLRSLLAQLATLHPPLDLDVLLLLSAERTADWAWARWLPQLPPTAVRLNSVGGPDDEPELEALLDRLIQRRRSRTGDGAAVGALGWTVVVVDRPLPARLAALLQDAGQLGVLTLTLAGTAETLPLRLSAVLTVGGETGERAVLSRRDRCGGAALLLDRLPESPTEELARDLASLQPPTSGLDLPKQVHLLDLPLPGLRLEGQEPVGGWTEDRSRLIATLGHSVSGPVQVDLCRDGPHALVAGTTGSGKSELLQTLITGLALAHPPDRCSFLLVDYKGGAAFAEAARLPHTVGVLTDLDGPATERALRSLGAELLRRERLLAAHQVNDLAALPEDVALARLVIVVDEFATLAEELPTFIPGLVGIAQRGRSLGVHLVLATQRPGGVVSPEIRANCTLRICLRTTDEADSRDVLGLPDAAHLPVGRPGLALIRAGTGAATVLQVARVAARRPLLGENAITVRRWSWPCAPLPAGSLAEEDTDLATICTALRRHAAGTGASLPHRPWRPPLPERFGSGEMGALLRTHGNPASEPPPSSPGRLRIGLVDRPAEQAWDFLEFDVAAAGGWLAVGGARSGRTTLLRTVLGEAVHELGADRLHVHVLDHGGGALAAEAADLPHAGTVVSGDDPLRTVRLVERLTEEVGRRRAGSGPAHPPTLLLLVDGVESLLEQLDEFEPRGGSASFLRLVREGAAVGLTCVLTAARAVPGGRLASAVSQRLVLPLADKADYLVAGVPASSVPSTRHPGRALVGESALECQLALPRRRLATAGSAPRHGTALRIPPLPDRPELPLPRGGAGRPDTGTRAALLLPVGPGGDEGHVLTVDLSRTGGLLVAGPPGSGRSSALTAFAGHLGCSGIPVLWLAPAHLRTGRHDDRATLDPADEAGIAAWVAGLEGGPGAVVADDVGLLGDAPALTRIPPSGWPARVLVLAAGGATDLARQYQGPVAMLRRQRAGLLLCPGLGDGDVLGVRLPRTPVPRRPGSGWLVTADAVQRVQVAGRKEHRDRSRPTPVREPV